MNRIGWLILGVLAALVLLPMLNRQQVAVVPTTPRQQPRSNSGTDWLAGLFAFGKELAHDISGWVSGGDTDTDTSSGSTEQPPEEMPMIEE